MAHSPRLETLARMDELNYTEFNGKRILVSVMAEPTAAPAIEAIDELCVELRKHPDRSVLVLLDVSGGKVIPEVTDHWKACVPVFDKHVQRAGIVGPALIRTIVNVVLIAARLGRYKLGDRVKAFATVAEARDYLVAP